MPPPSGIQQFASALPEDPPIEGTLRNYSSALIRVALSKEQLALVRVISMEAAKFPELGERFYELGPKRGEERLAAYLTKQVENGRLISNLLLHKIGARIWIAWILIARNLE